MATAPESDGRRRRLGRRLRVGELLALVAGAPVAIVLGAVVVGIITLSDQTSIRGDLLNRVEPANGAALRLTTAMVNQETGIRGYQLNGESQFLEPYHEGITQANQEENHLVHDAIPGTRRDLATVRARIESWETLTAGPAIRRTGARPPGAGGTIDASLGGKHQFDAIRAALSALQDEITLRVRLVKQQLASSAQTTTIAFSVIGAVLLAAALGAGIALQRLVSRPIRRLTASSRRVAAGDLSYSLRLSGPLDVEELASDVDAMRLRLLEEVEVADAARRELAAAGEDLKRSNAELEQFAYVASHDLQEPLRKVTSFCQLLQERYGGQLDERADQYIAFAVDGAARMQHLINDLLAFSRVGRGRGRRVRSDLGRLARAAVSDLDTPIEESGGRVTLGPLPVLSVEASLMQTVFQNLIGNSIKFRGEAAPDVDIRAERDGDEWRMCCTDRGIGIEAEYAERVFVIFQRLHSRELYAGTGIGLAMCRKIVEFHGGRIWLDSGYQGGTRICFTLPAELQTDESETMAA